jgi:uncharacterized protein
MAGEVVHYEIPVSDIERAKRFYEGVFGWQIGDSVMPDMEYRMARVGDSAGAALFPADTGHANAYLDVPNMDEALAKVKELGGSAEDKAPVPSMGWFARATDSEGNVLHLWQTDSSAGT